MRLPADWIVPDWPAPARVHAFVTTRAGGVSEVAGKHLVPVELGDGDTSVLGGGPRQVLGGSRGELGGGIDTTESPRYVPRTGSRQIGW